MNGENLDRAHYPLCDWNLYREDRQSDPDLCNLGCEDDADAVAAVAARWQTPEWRDIDD